MHLLNLQEDIIIVSVCVQLREWWLLVVIVLVVGCLIVPAVDLKVSGQSVHSLVLNEVVSLCLAYHAP